MPKQANCEVIKGFAVEVSKGKVVTYNKGQKIHLEGDSLVFAQENKCVNSLVKQTTKAR
jgi:hypothetical protein